MCFAYESHMDDIAVDLGIDPLEIRIEGMPFTKDHCQPDRASVAECRCGPLEKWLPTGLVGRSGVNEA